MLSHHQAVLLILLLKFLQFSLSPCLLPLVGFPYFAVEDTAVLVSHRLSLRLPQASLISSVPNSQGEWERPFLPLLLLFFLQRWDKLRISSMPSKCSSPRMSYPKQKLVSYHFVNKILECISGGNSNSLPWWGRGSFCLFFCCHSFHLPGLCFSLQ